MNGIYVNRKLGNSRKGGGGGDWISSDTNAENFQHIIFSSLWLNTKFSLDNKFYSIFFRIHLFELDTELVDEETGLKIESGFYFLQSSRMGREWRNN